MEVLHRVIVLRWNHTFNHATSANDYPHAFKIKSAMNGIFHVDH